MECFDKKPASGVKRGLQSFNCLKKEGDDMGVHRKVKGPARYSSLQRVITVSKLLEFEYRDII